LAVGKVVPLVAFFRDLPRFRCFDTGSH